MFFSLATLALAQLATGLPTSTGTASPPTSSAQAFVLVANITDLSKDLVPSVNHWQVTGIHIGAGQSGAVLTNNTLPGRIFFENGTDKDTGIAADGGRYPWGLYILENNPDSNGTQNIEWFGLQVGLAQTGFSIIDGKGGVPQVSAPASGTFVICNETHPAYGRPQFPVKFVKSQVVSGVTKQEIPELCAPVTLLPQCTKLDPVALDAQYNHDYVRSVKCYDDVSAIKW